MMRKCGICEQKNVTHLIDIGDDMHVPLCDMCTVMFPNSKLTSVDLIDKLGLIKAEFMEILDQIGIQPEAVEEDEDTYTVTVSIIIDKEEVDAY